MTFEESLEHLREALKPITADVGLAEVPELPRLDDGEPPPGCSLLCGDYALLVLCPVPPGNEGVLKLDAIKGKDWMQELLSWIDGLLSRCERTGRLMDAYLLLALASKPEDLALQEAVRRIELDTSLCRKHVLWPVPDPQCPNPWADRLARVTALALPAPPAPAQPADSPHLPRRAEEALAIFYQKKKNQTATRKALASLIDASALESE